MARFRLQAVFDLVWNTLLKMAFDRSPDGLGVLRVQSAAERIYRAGKLLGRVSKDFSGRSQSQRPSVEPARAKRYRSSLVRNAAFARPCRDRCMSSPTISKDAMAQKVARPMICHW
jgi:hypothetical protein